MSISSLTCDPPVRRPVQRTSLDYEKLDLAASLMDEGRPLESLGKVFEHFFPDRPPPKFDGAGFSFDQGSSRVTTKVEGDALSIRVPLVKLPSGGGAIAALRHILTSISATGQLYQPRLDGDDVYLAYEDRLSRFHPAKVVEVLRKMPSEADDNDDFLIGQFSAQPLDRVAIAPVSADEAARCDAIWRRHWADMEEILKDCQRKRSVWFLNETTAYAIHRILFALPLSGFVGSRLDEAASTFNDSDEEPLKREASLAKCIKEMKAVSADDLKKSLGHATYALDPLADGTAKRLGIIGPGGYMESIEQHRSSGRTFEAALGMIGTYHYLLARFSWDESVRVALEQGIAKASGKPWREAATILVEDAKTLFSEFGEPDDDDEDEDESDSDSDEEEDDDEDEDSDDSDDSDEEEDGQ